MVWLWPYTLQDNLITMLDVAVILISQQISFGKLELPVLCSISFKFRVVILLDQSWEGEEIDAYPSKKNLCESECNGFDQNSNLAGQFHFLHNCIMHISDIFLIGFNFIYFIYSEALYFLYFLFCFLGFFFHYFYYWGFM